MTLKFTNQDGTSATFNETAFSLAVPGDWNSVGDGPTRDAVQTWLAAGNVPEPYTPPDPNIEILNQIALIETATLMNRGSREGWIELIEKEAALQGITDQVIIAQYNPFYRRLIEVDNQIRALRSQIV